MWRRGEEVPGEQADYRKSRADYRAGDQSRTPGRPRQPPRLLHAASAQRCGHQRLAGDATESSMFIAKFQEEFTA